MKMLARGRQVFLVVRDVKASFTGSVRNASHLQRCTIWKIHELKLYIRNINYRDFKSLQFSTHTNVHDYSEEAERSKVVAADFLKKHNITIKGFDCPSPILSIKELQVDDSITKVLREHSIENPTPIQSLAWPLSINRKDFVGISKTGSGKTLGFVIPTVMHVINCQKQGLHKHDPLALVVVPTRELAKQIHDVYAWFKHQRIRSVCLYGGESKLYQMNMMRQGFNVCIATPGRLIDFLESNNISLKNCSFVVLDEADLMLDMGFERDMQTIFKYLPKEKIIQMWSATWPREVKNIAETYLSDYILLAVGSLELKPNENVAQFIEICSDKKMKINRLIDVLQDEVSKPDSKVLVFVETKKNVDWLESVIKKKGLHVSCVHGDKSQKERNIIVNAFKKGRPRIMVATAVASRGWDIDNITKVINYDCPYNVEQYIHKIGRTARHDKKGEAVTFVTPDDDHCSYLIDVLEKCKQEVPEELFNICKSKHGKQLKNIRNNYSRHPRDFTRYSKNY